MKYVHFIIVIPHITDRTIGSLVHHRRMKILHIN